MRRLIATALLLLPLALNAQRSETLLRDWIFNGKQKVSIPHDWAIYGPFDRSNDLQTVAVVQNGETEASEAIANGDPTCLESFRNPQMHLFSGALSFIVRSADAPGTIDFEVSSRGLRKASGSIIVKK